MSSFEKIFEGQPNDPIEFLYRENFITLSSIGSIFTFALIGSFRENIFDKIMSFFLPHESFDFMKVYLPDIETTFNSNPLNPQNEMKEPSVIHFGVFVRETIIWIFMILLLYILAIFVRWPIEPGFTFNIMKNFK